MSLEKLRELHAKKDGSARSWIEPGMGTLPRERALAWASLLTSIATSENIEGLILEPLKERYKSDLHLREYLESHGADEVRHYRWLTEFVRDNSEYVRTKKSLSSVLFYDHGLPFIAAWAETKPALLFSLMNFYEVFTMEFYRELRREAERDRLPVLVQMIDSIRRDEARHCAGAKILMEIAMQEGVYGYKDFIKLSLFLNLFRLDMSTDWWCLHNRRVRQSTRTLGLSARKMKAMSEAALKDTLDSFRRFL